jgi:glucose-1-phosphate adenylyltransferase
LGHYLRIVSPQHAHWARRWYRGYRRFSVRQNSYLIERDKLLSNIMVLSGDHVYKMDYRLFRQYHDAKGADVSISVIEVDRMEACAFGVVEVDEDFNIKGFHEKPDDPVCIPGDSEHALASMGIYIFNREVLLEVLDAAQGKDFGHDIIPSLLGKYKVVAYPYRARNRIEDYSFTTQTDGRRARVLEERTKDSGYWRDVGSLDAYWNANMDLCGVEPFFNLYGTYWPIHTYMRQLPPAKFVFASERANPPRVGKALDSMVGQGCIITGIVRDSVLSANVITRSWSHVSESVIMDNVIIGRKCKVKKAIIDKNNYIPDGTNIGVDPAEDKERFKVTPRGITVVPKGYFPAE